jgi:hypothetical protein
MAAIGDSVILSRVVDSDHHSGVHLVAVLGQADDWAVYSSRLDAIPEGLLGRARDVWVAVNGLKIDPKRAAFYFPVLNPKRYRP